MSSRKSRESRIFARNNGKITALIMFTNDKVDYQIGKILSGRKSSVSTLYILTVYDNIHP